MTKRTREKMSSKNAAVTIVCPGVEFSWFASPKSFNAIPTLVGAKAQPHANDAVTPYKIVF